MVSDSEGISRKKAGFAFSPLLLIPFVIMVLFLIPPWVLFSIWGGIVFNTSITVRALNVSFPFWSTLKTLVINPSSSNLAIFCWIVTSATVAGNQQAINSLRDKYTTF